MFRYPENKRIDLALEEASWVLNEGGMKRFFSELKVAESKKKNIILEGTSLTETYTGLKTRNYVGRYKTDGVRCNCSWFMSRLICRHVFVYRMGNSMSLLDKAIFHSSFTVG